ncbi:Zinc finger bed domain-containing protein 1-like protein, partial [Gryllus bimaculatus]
MMQLEENTLRMDYPRVWTSTYVMLEQLLIRRNIIISILTTADIVERDEFMLTQAEWKIMEEVVMVLEPFKVLIMTLSEEKTPFISLLKPLLCQLNNSHMKAKDSDSESAKKFKTFLSENLFQRYNDPKVHQLLQTATMLDARFKLLPDANEDDKNIVSGCIKEMLIKFMDEEQISNVAEEQSDERSRLSGNLNYHLQLMFEHREMLVNNVSLMLHTLNWGSYEYFITPTAVQK